MRRPEPDRGRKPPTIPRSVAGPWRVMCRKSSGAMVTFATYATQREALRIVARLAEVGAASVAVPDEATP